MSRSEGSGSARDGWGGRPVGLAERIDRWLVEVDRWRSRPIAIAVALALAVSLGLAGWWWGRAPSQRPIEELVPQVSVEPTTPDTPTSVTGELVVHVAGAVQQPGVYVLDATSRVVDAVEAAGGFAEGADGEQLNLAAFLVDGAQVRVPRVGEVPVAPSGTTVGADPGTAVGAGPLDLNRANATDLDTLPGIGPTTALAIVTWRDEQGPFTSVDDLLDVPGIGPAKLEALSGLVVVR